MADETKSTVVQMRFQPNTMKRMEHIAEMTNNSNKAQLVSSSIAIAEIIFSSIQDGSSIYIDKKDGTREKLTLVGL